MGSAEKVTHHLGTAGIPFTQVLRGWHQLYFRSVTLHLEMLSFLFLLYFVVHTVQKRPHTNPANATAPINTESGIPRIPVSAQTSNPAAVVGGLFWPLHQCHESSWRPLCSAAQFLRMIDEKSRAVSCYMTTWRYKYIDKFKELRRSSCWVKTGHVRELSNRHLTFRQYNPRMHFWNDTKKWTNKVLSNPDIILWRKYP